MSDQRIRFRISNFKLSQILKVISDAESLKITPDSAFISFSWLFIESQEILFSEIAIFVSIILLINFIYFAFAERTYLSHASLMILLALSLAHKTELTELSKYFSENLFTFLY